MRRRLNCSDPRFFYTLISFLIGVLAVSAIVSIFDSWLVGLLLLGVLLLGGLIALLLRRSEKNTPPLR